MKPVLNLKTCLLKKNSNKKKIENRGVFLIQLRL